MGKVCDKPSKPHNIVVSCCHGYFKANLKEKNFVLVIKVCSKHARRK